MENEKRKNEVGVFQMMRYISNVSTDLFDENDLEKLEERMVMIINDFSEHLGIHEIDDLEKIIEDLSMQNWFIYKDRCYDYKGNLNTIRKYFMSAKRNCFNCKFITHRAPDGHDKMYSQEFCEFHKKFLSLCETIKKMIANNLRVANLPVLKTFAVL